jgi:hypothetical protein
MTFSALYILTVILLRKVFGTFFKSRFLINKSGSEHNGPAIRGASDNL